MKKEGSQIKLPREVSGSCGWGVFLVALLLTLSVKKYMFVRLVKKQMHRGKCTEFIEPKSKLTNNTDSVRQVNHNSAVVIIYIYIMWLQNLGNLQRWNRG